MWEFCDSCERVFLEGDGYFHLNDSHYCEKCMDTSLKLQIEYSETRQTDDDAAYWTTQNY